MKESVEPEEAVSPPASATLDDCLESLRSRIGADRILLADASGSMIATTGNGVALDPLVFASLAPAHLVLAHDLASLVGGVEVSALVQQGGATTVLLSGANDGIVAAVHSVPLPAEKLTALADAMVTDLDRIIEAIEGSIGSPLSERWRLDAEKRVDRVFREGA